MSDRENRERRGTAEDAKSAKLAISSIPLENYFELYFNRNK